MDMPSNLVENFISKLLSAVCDNPGEDFGERMQEIETALHEMIQPSTGVGGKQTGYDVANADHESEG